MSTYLDGRVYSVGDGLCYEGMIKNGSNDNYHFVIDCGNKTPTCKRKWEGKLLKNDCSNRLDEITDEIASKGDNIDLFILTHMHMDHYSGYEKLFNKTKIDTIIMPYLYPEERLYLIMDKRMDDEDAMFLANPYSTVLDLAKRKNDDAKLVLIRGNSDQRDDSYRDNTDSGESVWGENHENYNEIIDIENLGKDKNDVYVVRAFTSGSAILENTWIFKFFNIEVDKKDISMFRSAFGVLDASNLCQKLTNPTERKKLNNQYKSIAKNLGKDVNNTSIVTYYAPVEGIGKDGSLITGDISLRLGIADKITNFYKEEIERVGFFSIPHHGSKDNWDDKFIMSGNLDNTVCFATTHNYYSGRLPYNMMSDLRCHNITVLVVDENRFSEIYQHTCSVECKQYICQRYEEKKRIEITVV